MMGVGAVLQDEYGTIRAAMVTVLPYVSELRVLAIDFQPFSLYLGKKTTFYFPIKKYPTIDSLTFPYIN